MREEITAITTYNRVTAITVYDSEPNKEIREALKNLKEIKEMA